MQKLSVQKIGLYVLFLVVCTFIMRFVMSSISPKFEKIIAKVLKSEGVFSTDVNDTGNYTPSGEFKGTKYGISARAFPDIDIKNLTKNQAIEIYKAKYWNKINGETLEPINLAYQVMDHSVNAGVGSANLLLSRSGFDLEKFKSQREIFYRGIAIGSKAKYLTSWLNRIQKTV